MKRVNLIAFQTGNRNFLSENFVYGCWRDKPFGSIPVLVSMDRPSFYALVIANLVAYIPTWRSDNSGQTLLTDQFKNIHIINQIHVHISQLHCNTTTNVVTGFLKLSAIWILTHRPNYLNKDFSYWTRAQFALPLSTALRYTV